MRDLPTLLGMHAAGSAVTADEGTAGTPAGGRAASGAERSDAVRPAGSRRVLAVLLALACAVILLDAVSKIIVVAYFGSHPSVVLISGVLELVEVRNAGAAFGFAAGATVVFTVVAAVVVVVIARAARRLHSGSWAVALGLLLGGALGNGIDRIVRHPGPLRGHVVDWIYLHHWPVFNLADSAIVIGGVLAVALSARGVTVDGGRMFPPSDGGTGADPRPREDGAADGRQNAAPEGAPAHQGGGTPTGNQPGTAGDAEPAGHRTAKDDSQEAPGHA